MNSQSHPEIEERGLTPARGEIRYDKVLREKLVEFRAQPNESNNTIAKRIGVNVAVISQYLNEGGCKYSGDVPRIERLITDLLDNEARRRASGVETTSTSVSEQVCSAFEFIRKTNDVGVVVDESGDGKTRGIEAYVKGCAGLDGHPTTIVWRTFAWATGMHDVQAFMFDEVGKKNYDGRTNRMVSTVKNLRGSDRLIVADDAHKLTRQAFQFFFDLHDATQCPVALVGTFDLLTKLEDDPQRFSRVGLHFEIAKEQGPDHALLKHLITSIVPNSASELEELMDLCEQVAKEHGHYRSVHKQLKLAVELRSASHAGKTQKRLSYVQAFKAAHTMLIRNYNLA